MNLMMYDNILDNPLKYVEDIYANEFQNVPDGDKVFKGIQPRGFDEFAAYCLTTFPLSKIKYNFVRRSPYKQEEPNFIHTDEMMGSITCILYLNESPPTNDGTLFYDDDNSVCCSVSSKFNRMVAFNSDVKHSRAIFDNYGDEYNNSSRLIQVIFLEA